MNQAQFKTRLRNLLGPRAAFRVDAGACTDPVMRSSAIDLARGARQRIADLNDKINRRTQELLAADFEIQELKREKAGLGEALDDENARALRYRITAGTNRGWCFDVAAQGDSFQAVIEQIEAKLKRAT